MKITAKLRTKTHTIFQGFDRFVYETLTDLIWVADQNCDDSCLSVIRSTSFQGGIEHHREIIFSTEDDNPLSPYIGFEWFEDDTTGTMVVDTRVLKYFIFGTEMSLLDCCTKPEDKKFVMRLRRYLRGQEEFANVVPEV